MKKLLLFILSLSIGMLGYSQRAAVDKELLKSTERGKYVMITGEEPTFMNPTNPSVAAPRASDREDLVIGDTWYDLQSNSALSGRFVTYADGSMAFVWTRGMTEAGSWPDRGSGYNFFDGNSWGPSPTARVETIRCGWPNITPWGSDGEMLVSHNGVESLTINTRPTRGTGDWTESTFYGPEGFVDDLTWPRSAVSGENNEYTHIIANSYYGIPTSRCVDLNANSGEGVFYSRSSDGGETWDIDNIQLPGMEVPDDFLDLNGDAYSIFAKGNTVIILFSYYFTDFFYLRSDDNGDNWEKTTIWPSPFGQICPYYDSIGASFYPTRAVGALDNTGKVHVAFGIGRYQSTGGGYYTSWPMVEGIGYWNEDMAPFSSDTNALSPYVNDPDWGPGSEMVDNYNLIGWSQDINGNDSIEFPLYPAGSGKFPPRYNNGLCITGMPTIAIDDQNRIYVAWSALTETFDNGTDNYRKIWARAYDNGEWGPFFHVSGNDIHYFDECVWPQLTVGTTGQPYIVYNGDLSPGSYIGGGDASPQTSASLNSMWFSELPYDSLLTSLKEIKPELSPNQVSQNYPNPFIDNTTVTVHLDHAASLSLEVTSLTGQRINIYDLGNVKAGTYFFNMKRSNMVKGIYFYTVKAGNGTVTKKMIVN